MTVTETKNPCKRKYSVRFAATKEEVSRAQNLRYTRFVADEGSDGGVDVDDFDAASQHLIGEDERTGALVCYFRLRLFEQASDIS